MKKINKNKIIAIIGPTASGKTKIAVALAIKFNGEIVSADSRQVYRGMDIGTGKDKQEYQIKTDKLSHVPYYLIDVATPDQNFNLADYQRLAFKAIDDILQRGKLPILVGGSGLYLQAIVDNYLLTPVNPDWNRRKTLEQKTDRALFEEIKKLSPDLAKKISQSDRKNKRRLVRYLEILKAGDKIKNISKQNPKYDCLLIGLAPDREELKQKIADRLSQRLERQGLVSEVENLHQNGLDWQRLDSFGLEYRFVSRYLQKKICYEELIKQLNIAIRQFAKRQMTWFRRWEKQGRKIFWLDSYDEIEKVIRKFLIFKK